MKVYSNLVSRPPCRSRKERLGCPITAAFYVACQALPSIFSVFSSFFGRRL